MKNSGIVKGRDPRTGRGPGNFWKKRTKAERGSRKFSTRTRADCGSLVKVRVDFDLNSFTFEVHIFLVEKYRDLIRFLVRFLS